MRVAFLFLPTFVAAPLVYAGTYYHVTDVGTLGGSTIPTAINNRGEIVGLDVGPQLQGQPFLWRDGALQDLNTLIPPESGWRLTSAQDINDQGQIIGHGYHNGEYKSYLWQENTITDLGTISAIAINNRGQIAAYEYDATTAHSWAYLWEDGSLTPLGNLDRSVFEQVWVTGINNLGQILGNCTDLADYTDMSFIWSNGSMKPLAGFGKTDCRALAINDPGQVIGFVREGYGAYNFLWYNGDIEKYYGRFLPIEINRHGQIVGHHYDGYAFIMEDGVITNLDDVLLSNEGIGLHGAYGINDHGQIIAYSTGTPRHGYLLTPVPEPLTLPFLGLGFCFVRRKWRTHQTREVAAHTVLDDSHRMRPGS